MERSNTADCDTLGKVHTRKRYESNSPLVLALLKYPVPYSAFDTEQFLSKPPKCYFDTEREIVNWALGPPFDQDEVKQFISLGIDKGRQNTVFSIARSWKCRRYSICCA